MTRLNLPCFVLLRVWMEDSSFAVRIFNLPAERQKSYKTRRDFCNLDEQIKILCQHALNTRSRYLHRGRVR